MSARLPRGNPAHDAAGTAAADATVIDDRPAVDATNAVHPARMSTSRQTRAQRARHVADPWIEGAARHGAAATTGLDTMEHPVVTTSGTPHGSVAHPLTRDLDRAHRSAQDYTGIFGVRPVAISHAAAPAGEAMLTVQGSEGGVGGIDAYLDTNDVAA